MGVSEEVSMLVLGYHVRDYQPNTNVMQVNGPITDVNTIGERIKWAREQRGLSQEALAKKAGVSQGTIGNIESGLRKQPRDLLKIARALQASPDWLESGRGPWQAEESNVTAVVSKRRIPIISWVIAGTWADVQDTYHPGEADEWADAYDTRPGDNAFALRVTGDSMTSNIPGDRTFPEGTVIIVDPARAASAGDFVVAKDVATQRATFKRLVSDGGRWYLKPLNPTYPTVEIDSPEVRVIGRVIEFQTRGKL